MICLNPGELREARDRTREILTSAGRDVKARCSDAPADLLLAGVAQEASNRLVQELFIRRAATGPGRVSPKGWDGGQGPGMQEPRSIARMAGRDVPLRFRWHVEQGYLDRPQRACDIAPESRPPPSTILLLTCHPT